MKKFLAVLISLVAIMSLVACGDSEESVSKNEGSETEAVVGGVAEDTADAGGDFVIGFSNCSQDTPFFANMTPIIEEYAAEKGIKVVSLNADNDVVKQNKDIQDLIVGGIDILIMNPVNEDGPSAGIKACNDAGIPIITVDKNVKEGYDVWVGRDNEVMGTLVGENLIELLGGPDAEGTVLEIQGTAGSTTMMQRRDGFNKALEAAPNLTVVQSNYCDYDRSKAIPATQDLVQANDNIVAIYGHNDDMAIGAAQVCQEQGLLDVLVCGVDGLMEAVLMIEGGTYHCTTSNDPVLLGQTSVDVAIDLMNGVKVDDFVDAGTVVIDESNVSEYADPELDFATMVK